MGLRSRKSRFESLISLGRRSRRSCLDRWRHDALVRFRKRRRAPPRRRAVWLFLVLTWLLSPSRPTTFAPFFRRNSYAPHRNPTPDETLDPRRPEGTPWTEEFSRTPLRRGNPRAASGRLARVVRKSRDYRGRPADDPLQPDRQVGRRLF